MNQADVSRLISKLRIKVAPRHRNLKNVDGPEGRLLKLRKTVTALVKHERIELNWIRADETRGYAERLISDAIRYGDCHRATMDMADYWLLEKQLVHKLFKVLVPRFQECPTSYTRLLRSSQLTGMGNPRALLELRGHPYPPLFVDTYKNRSLLHNVLLDEAAKAYRAQKFAEVSSALENPDEVEAPSESVEVSPSHEGNIASEVNSEKLKVTVDTSSESKTTNV